MTTQEHSETFHYTGRLQTSRQIFMRPDLIRCLRTCHEICRETACTGTLTDKSGKSGYFGKNIKIKVYCLLWYAGTKTIPA